MPCSSHCRATSHSHNSDVAQLPPKPAESSDGPRSAEDCAGADQSADDQAPSSATSISLPATMTGHEAEAQPHREGPRDAPAAGEAHAPAPTSIGSATAAPAAGFFRKPSVGTWLRAAPRRIVAAPRGPRWWAARAAFAREWLGPLSAYERLCARYPDPEPAWGREEWAAAARAELARRRDQEDPYWLQFQR